MTKLACALALALVPAAAWAQRGDPPAEKLGKVSFRTSCTAPAQKEFDHALALLHSFAYPETVKAFASIPAVDPACAIAYWGVAMSLRANPLMGPWDAETLRRGLEAVEKGEAVGAKTRRERDWLAAARAFYQDYATVEQDTRTKAYEQGMSALARKYPDDVEAKAFHALALNEIFDRRDPKPLQQAIRILQPLAARYPEHPGIAHYLVLSHDSPKVAKKALSHASRYARIAAAAPQAQHLPSHLYAMLGMWKEALAANQGALKAAAEFAERAKLDSVLAGVPHAYDLMAYAYLQLGQDAKAAAMVGEVAKATKVAGPGLEAQIARAAAPARYVLERQDWKGAAQLEVPGSAFPAAEALTRFARGLGAARSGTLPQAQAEAERLGELRAALEKAREPCWAEQVAAQQLALRAWIAHAKGERREALKLMRGAADLEDARTTHAALENRLYPLRELLADLQREQGDPGAALTEYELALKAAPGRVRSFYGAARAAEGIGQKKMAMTYWLLLSRLTQDADGDRPEIAETRQALSRAQ